MVVITGGAQGIGKKLANKMAIQENAIVCILDSNEVINLLTQAIII